MQASRQNFQIIQSWNNQGCLLTCAYTCKQGLRQCFWNVEVLYFRKLMFCTAWTSVRQGSITVYLVNDHLHMCSLESRNVKNWWGQNRTSQTVRYGHVGYPTPSWEKQEVHVWFVVMRLDKRHSPDNPAHPCNYST